MLKLNVLNLERFLDVVNGCRNAINMIGADGQKENINKKDSIQREIQGEYSKNKGLLPITLEISDYKDYLSIVYYYIGDC
ncbi:ribonuclease HII [Oscillospiraceae bacterium PP1C4]